jgi:hypothetical protein
MAERVIAPSDFQVYREKGGGSLPPWFLLNDQEAAEIATRLTEAYPKRAASLPFAGRIDNDDVAVFSILGSSVGVEIIHMGAAPGWEGSPKGRFDTFAAWLKAAVEDCIAYIANGRS